MALHCQLFFSTILYFIVFLSSIVELSSILYAKGSLSSCFLYVRTVDSTPSNFVCNVNIYAFAAAAIYAVIMAVYHGYGTVVASRENHIGRTMWVMPWLLLNSFTSILMFIFACVYSVGLYITCSGSSSIFHKTEGCSLKSNTYRLMSVAQIGAWLSVLFWCGLVILEGVRLMRNRRALSREVYVEPNASDLARIGEVTPTA
ncbi:hypothetical protein X975_17897, partial [Stegodyphus mimosarum]